MVSLFILIKNYLLMNPLKTIKSKLLMKSEQIDEMFKKLLTFAYKKIILSTSLSSIKLINHGHELCYIIIQKYYIY